MALQGAEQTQAEVSAARRELEAEIERLKKLVESERSTTVE
ncbi:hypothetical protein [Deinococcus hopiensis]|uniref:Uncharacterized protein n=1 Tax=Deinococcus hopiensis KR-140 TaxID=695939 RepID=A0A1W1UZF2_9DEIO|nr:hypothetical protein [Deinococcus hopiensis]SMB86094.1 hypothetical protein SAMN00790413_03682 [Deinococcus hopiensis KR-140]